MDQHVKIIGILDIIFGAFGIVFGLMFILGFGLGAAGISTSGEQGASGAAAIMASVGVFGGIFIMAMGAFEILVGVYLRQHRPWARIVQIVFGVMALPGFPVGTAFGIYSLWAMLTSEGAAVFEEQNKAA